MSFAQKLKDIKAKLPPECHLLIVSKTRPESDIISYYELGHRDFGENRVQDLQTKAENLKEKCPEIRWHMIGHLQSNKLKTLFKIPHLHAVHSVHDHYLVDKMIEAQDLLDHPVDIYLQFNTSHEEEKSGFVTYTDLRTSVESILKAPKLKFKGLMTMGKLRTEAFEAEARRCFQELQVEKDKLESEFGIKLETSMGMSQDYHIAIEEKSNWIRLGTMMFT